VAGPDSKGKAFNYLPLFRPIFHDGNGLNQGYESVTIETKEGDLKER